MKFSRFALARSQPSQLEKLPGRMEGEGKGRSHGTDTGRVAWSKPGQVVLQEHVVRRVSYDTGGWGERV